LEEKQIELEKKLIEEKKSVVRNYLLKTLEENKYKIEEKKKKIEDVKNIEKSEQALLRQQYEDEIVKNKEEKVKKKFEIKKMMSKQLEEISKKKEDAYELDKLAQVEADKKNNIFDNEQQHKTAIREQLIKQAVFGNQEILDHNKWKNDLSKKLVRDDLTSVNNDYDNYIKENSEVLLKNKYDKDTNKQSLRYMINENSEMQDRKLNNTIKVEKTLIKDADKFDVHVDNIVLQKRA